VALTATIYSLETQLADIDRGVYEHLSLRVARQPSETSEYMSSPKELPLATSLPSSSETSPDA
jgi:hypothetical protein